MRIDKEGCGGMWKDDERGGPPRSALIHTHSAGVKPHRPLRARIYAHRPQTGFAKRPDTCSRPQAGGARAHHWELYQHFVTKTHTP